MKVAEKSRSTETIKNNQKTYWKLEAVPQAVHPRIRLRSGHCHCRRGTIGALPCFLGRHWDTSTEAFHNWLRDDP
jgi:hypothetical protein